MNNAKKNEFNKRNLSNYNLLNFNKCDSYWVKTMLNLKLF